MISIIPIDDVPIFEYEAQLWDFIENQITSELLDGDILICAHTPWSRVLGHTYKLKDIKPSTKAIELSENLPHDVRLIEVILRESQRIIKTGRGVFITENHANVIGANAGVDQSNAGIGNAIAVPPNPDELAQSIRDFIEEESEKQVAVIISDTTGRALRRGAVNIAIGCSGIDAIRTEKGKNDLFGYTMRSSDIAHIDEIAAAAELVQGQVAEGRPFVILRGYDYTSSEHDRSAKFLNRPDEERLFK